jgi:hypothetical protein
MSYRKKPRRSKGQREHRWYKSLEKKLVTEPAPEKTLRASAKTANFASYYYGK